jgi:hypothetical protein
MQELLAFSQPVFTSTDLKIRTEKIMELLGHEQDDPGAFFITLVDSCIALSFDFIHPQVTITIHKIEKLDLSQGILVVENKQFKINPIVAKQLQDSEKVAFFACTIGKALEKHFESLFQIGDVLEGYIYSLIGSEAAEYLAELAHKHIEGLARKENLNVTNRFSPGYCKWNVAEQHKLFEMFPKDSTTIKLTESALMNPIKSVSGIIGIGANVLKKEYQCKTCTEEKCLYRDRYE